MLRFVPFLVVFLAALSPVSGYARTLFIDFNNAEREIAVFKHSHKGQPTEVVVVPSYARISEQQRLAVLSANADIEKYTLKVQACATSGGKSKQHCDKYYDRIRQAELDRLDATGGYTFDDLKAELLALSDSGKDKPFDMLVISGHHELGYYRGELTEAKILQFAEVLTQTPELFSRVNTVVLLGCSTGTKDVFAQNLAPMFPRVPLIFGAEDNAPTRDEARNLAYLRKLVMVRPKLLSAKTAQEVEPLFQSLLAKNWPVSLLWRQNTVFFKDGVEPF
jgi:hypothetical protein